jgi:hypothetical protein
MPGEERRCPQRQLGLHVEQMKMRNAADGGTVNPTQREGSRALRGGVMQDDAETLCDFLTLLGEKTRVEQQTARRDVSEETN